MKTLPNFGFFVSLYGLALILFWIGIFKFTATESKAIEPLVKNSPFMGWLYSYLSIQGVSNLIGAIEIITALLLMFFPFAPRLSFIGGALGVFTFLLTLSFLFSSPNGFEKIDGIWLPDAFILKDLMALGISLQVLERSYRDIL